jgi:NAD(P)-dependent dehydrogenase (short-subunit alcohol dehydrogenase family)
MARTTTPLTDHVAIVTGAGQGIGKASALALAEAGATVVAVDINEGTLAETAGELRKLGARTLAIRADLGSVPEIDRLVTETMAAFGQIDILVNNAGVTRRAYIMDLTEEDWDRIHRVNAKGVFFCLQRVARK